MSGSSANELRSAGLQYADLGWHVMPLYPIVDGKCGCGNPGCRAAGKHPRWRDWPARATTDPEKIRAFWRNGTANGGLAIVTGKASGLLVLDVDARHGGKASIEKILDMHGPLATVTAYTGGGGLHIYFRHPGGTICSVAGLSDEHPGLDIRADGGCVVAPPSDHISGCSYEWELGPGQVKLAPVPPWLLMLLQNRKEHRSSVLTNTVGKCIGVGTRNNFLTSLGGKLRNVGLESPEIEAVLQLRNEVFCETPLERTEVHGIARSIGRYPPDDTSDTPRTQTAVDYLDWETLKREGIRPIDWILPEWLARKDIAVLAGAGGIGKSTTVADLAVACAAGRKWCGIAPTRRCAVLYCDEEQDAATTARLFLRLAETPPENLHVACGAGCVFH